jgi:hypothetical protein
MLHFWQRRGQKHNPQPSLHRTRTGARPKPGRLLLEDLEDRCLLSDAPLGTAQLAAAYGQVPLSFEANQGQTDSQVRFLSRGSGYALFLTPGETVVSLHKPGGPGNDGAAVQASADTVLHTRLVGANAAPQVIGLEKLPGTSNYFIGNDPTRWQANVPNYGKVAYQNIYPGINLVYYGNQRQLEYDFVVASGANPGVIKLAFEGAQDMTLDHQGNLVLHTAGGDVVEQAPVLYQQAGGARQAISGHYVLGRDDQVGFAVGAYDASRPLVIDPVLSYSTLLGGSRTDLSADRAGIAVDAAGNAYVTGITDSFDFPTTPGTFQTAFAGHPAFVTKLNAAGSALVYSTYLGGSGGDTGRGIAVDAAGNAYVMGDTSSTNFPTTPGAFQTAFGGSISHVFVAKLNAAGSALVYSTYLGGSRNEFGGGIAVDAAGNAFVTGSTSSTNFPTTPGAFQTANGGGADAFVAKLNAAGSALVYSTYLGGSGTDSPEGIAVDAAGNAYVTGITRSTNFPTTLGAFQTAFGGGDDAFVAKLNAAGSALVYSTYLGGSGNDAGSGIAVDAGGNAYVTGDTSSTNFPTTPSAFQTTNSGGQDAFVAKLNAAGSALVYSTYLGGSGSDGGRGIAVDAAGNAYVTGGTSSTNFPTANPLQPAFGGGSGDAFVAKLNAAGSALVYSTYLGGSGTDANSNISEVGTGIAVDAAGNAYVTGDTASTNFPTTPGAFQTTNHGRVNVFIAKIAPGQAAITSTTTLSSSLNPSVFGQAVTFTATVSTTGPGTPTGTVTFTIDGTAQTPVPLSGGQATFATSTLAVGTHSVAAAYSGDNTFSGSSGSLAPDQTVNPTGTEAPLVGVGIPVNGFELTPLTNVTLATLTHPNDVEPASDFSATINWGDGTTSAGTVASTDGGFEVRGSHIYTDEGTFPIIVTASEANASTTINTNATVLEELLSGGTRGTANQRFITEVYRDLLHRQTDAGGLANWSGLLDQGVSRSQVVLFIESCTTLEYRHIQVEDAYLAFLQRHADPLGMSSAAAFLQAGGTTEALAAQIIGSPEYAQKSGVTNAGFLQALYQDVLKRTLDEGGRAFWDQALARGMSPVAVASAFFASNEYRTEQVQSYYHQFLDRTAEPGGLNSWMAHLQHGDGDDQVIAAIIGEPHLEFFNKIASGSAE